MKLILKREGKAMNISSTTIRREVHQSTPCKLLESLNSHPGQSSEAVFTGSRFEAICVGRGTHGAFGPEVLTDFLIFAQDLRGGGWNRQQPGQRVLGFLFLALEDQPFRGLGKDEQPNRQDERPSKLQRKRALARVLLKMMDIGRLVGLT